MIKSISIIAIFNKVIKQYHLDNELEKTLPIISDLDFEDLILNKCLVDTIQWHLEDEVRNPALSPKEGWSIKKKIDRYNQVRTDIVEELDKNLFQHFSRIQKETDASLNSETPAWIIDRMSILCLKIFHMEEQTLRTDVDQSHISKCKEKLSILMEQQVDLNLAFDQLILDLETGKKYMKLYLQMKMYNDEALNPVLYKNK